MSNYARAAAVLAQLPPDDAAAVQAARETVPALLNGSPRACAAVRALVLEDRRRSWGEDAVTAERLVDAVLGAEPAVDWPPTPHVPGPPAPEPLPLDSLSPALRSHVAAVAGATQTAPDLGAMLALACISAAAGSRVEVEVDARGWTEPANIYTAVILPPASRKSAVYAAMVKPLIEWESEEQAHIGPSYRRARDRVDVAAAALAATKAAAAKGKGTADEVEAARTELDEAEAAVPVLPRLLAADATPEALVRLMAEQGGRIALMAPEADPIGIADGRYSDSARVDELLRAWSAEAIRVDRINREPVHVERPALTLGLTMQPSVLEDVRHGRTMRGRGLLARVLWCVPQHGLGTRRTGRNVPSLDVLAAQRYGRLLRSLLDAGSAGSAGAPQVLRLTDDALDVLYAFEAEVERELPEGKRLGGVQDWAGKVHGQAVRLAALIELGARAEDGRPLWTEPIGGWAMEAAVRLARALTSHALAVLTEMGMDARTADLRYVLRRAGDLPEGSTLRDLHDATRDRRGLETMEQLHPVVDALVERGCIRLVERNREGPGRPPSPGLELHPVLRATIQDRHPQNPHNPVGGSETGISAGSAGAYRESAPETEGPPAEVFDSAEVDR